MVGSKGQKQQPSRQKNGKLLEGLRNHLEEETASSSSKATPQSVLALKSNAENLAERLAKLEGMLAARRLQDSQPQEEVPQRRRNIRLESQLEQLSESQSATTRADMRRLPVVLTEGTVPLREVIERLRGEALRVEESAGPLLGPAEPTNACSALSRLQILGLRSQWQRELDKETCLMHHKMVMQDLLSAMPLGSEGPVAELLEIVGCWLKSGMLLATSTLCAQQQLQEAVASSRSQAPELFRKDCWYGALHNLLQIQPSAGDSKALAHAVAAHWRKRYGICLHFDAGKSEDFEKLLAIVRKIWQPSQEAQQNEQQCSAELEALNAEQALLEELDAEEQEQQKKQAKGKKRKAKKTGTQKCNNDADKSAASTVDASHLEEEQPQDGVASNCKSQLENSTAAAKCQKSRATRKKQPRVEIQPAPPRATSTQARQPADLDSILEAVRKSEELHKSRSQACNDVRSEGVSTADVLFEQDVSETISDYQGEPEIDTGVQAQPALPTPELLIVSPTPQDQHLMPPAPLAPAPTAFPDHSPKLPEAPTWKAAVLPEQVAAQEEDQEAHESEASDQEASGSKITQWPPLQRSPNRKLIRRAIRMSGEVNRGSCQTASASCALLAAGQFLSASMQQVEESCDGSKPSTPTSSAVLFTGKDKWEETSTCAPSGLEETFEMASSRDSESVVSGAHLRIATSGAKCQMPDDLQEASAQLLSLQLQQKSEVVASLPESLEQHRIASQPEVVQLAQSVLPPAPDAPAPIFLQEASPLLPEAPSWSPAEQPRQSLHTVMESSHAESEGNGCPTPPQDAPDTGGRKRALVILSDLLPDPQMSGNSAPLVPAGIVPGMTASEPLAKSDAEPALFSGMEASWQMNWQMEPCNTQDSGAFAEFQNPWCWEASGGGSTFWNQAVDTTPAGGDTMEVWAAAPAPDQGIPFASWLSSSGLPTSGAHLAEILKAVAPESYED